MHKHFNWRIPGNKAVHRSISYRLKGLDRDIAFELGEEKLDAGKITHKKHNFV